MSNEAALAGLGTRVRKLIDAEAGGEPILAVVPGRESQAVALTRNRVISAQGTLIIRACQSVRISDIVNASSGLTALQMELSNGSTYELPLWPTQIQTAKDFIGKLHAAQDEGSSSNSASISTPSSASGVADELAKLAQLRDQGVLTEQEFQAQKASLLA